MNKEDSENAKQTLTELLDLAKISVDEYERSELREADLRIQYLKKCASDTKEKILSTVRLALEEIWPTAN